VPKQEMEAIEEFDADLVEELRNRARDNLLTRAIAVEETIGKAQPADDLLQMEGMDEHTAKLLASNGIETREDLADQAVDELMEAVEGIDEEQAKALIMKAREIWFEGEESEQ